MSRSFYFLLALGGAVPACWWSANVDTVGSGAGVGASPNGSAASGAGGAGGAGGFASTSGTGMPRPCNQDPDVDGDGDGWTPNEGDCNDCDPNVNPGAIEVIVTAPGPDGGIPEPVDDDCDGVVDNVLPPCDDGLALDDADPMNGARALDLCQVATANPAEKKDRRWGVLDARYVSADGSEARVPGLQVGLLDGFGPHVHVQEGARMLALSSGHARLPGQPGACGYQSCTTTSNVDAPPGFPQVVPSCDGGTIINDDIALEISLRAPTNAVGYAFSFKFSSFEYPEWVCTPYNDQFIALVSPAPAGSINGNISFDAMHNPVSVNLAFFDVCDPADEGAFATNCGAPFNPSCPAPPNPYCPSGAAELEGTGFDLWGTAGATRWLATQAPVKGGAEITIRFAIWDTADQALDSTVLLDGFNWLAAGGVAVGTDPLGSPK